MLILRGKLQGLTHRIGAEFVAEGEETGSVLILVQLPGVVLRGEGATNERVRNMERI